MTMLRVGLLSLCLLAVATTAFAQEDADSEDANNEDTVAPIREQTIYVPYNRLRDVFEKPGRGVFLPYPEFKKLWDEARAGKPPAAEDRPPVGALIVEIESEATVAAEVVNVQSSLTIELLTEGWHEIPLRLEDAAILSAKLGDQPARIVFKPKSGYVLLIEKKGDVAEQVILSLEYARKFDKSPGRNSVAFAAPKSPVNRWRVRIPQSGVKVNVQPLIAATEQPPAESGEEETVILAFVGAAASVQVDWTPKAEGATGLAALATVQSEQQLTVEQGVIRSKTQLHYSISRAELSKLVLETPSEFKVLNVFDPNVKEWSVEKDGDINRITAQLYEPARESQQLLIELERFSDTMVADGVRAPSIKASDASRQQGVVVVRVAAGLRSETMARNGLLQLDNDELPQALRGGGWTYSYRYAAIPYQLTLGVEEVQPLIRTRELVEAYVEPEKLTLDLVALYEIERAGVFLLELDIPGGFEIRQVRGYAAAGAVAAAVDTHSVTGDDDTRLVVNLSRKAIGKVGLLVELERRMNDPNLLSPTGVGSDIPIPLPRVAPAGVEQSTGRLIVYAPESLRVNPVRQTGVQPVSFAEALEQTESARSGRFAGARQVMAFAYTGDDADIALSVQRRQPQITASQLLQTRIEEGVAKFEATFYYEILYSGVKSLRLDVPAEWSNVIRNQSGASIRDAVLDPQPDDVSEGYVAWSLTGDAELLGNVTVTLVWEKKSAELDVGDSVLIGLPILKPAAVDRAWGQIVVAKVETLDVQAEREGSEGLRAIDPRHDLMRGVNVPDAAMAFEFHGDWALNLKATRYQLEEVKHTSIERSVVRIEVTLSDQLSVQALYQMRSARQRLAVVLPDNATFDAEPLRIDGRAVSLESGDSDEYYIPLLGQNVDKPFLLELRYTTPGDASRLDLPGFPDEPAVQKVYLCSYLPQERTLLGAGGPWTNEMNWRWYEPFAIVDRPSQDDSDLVRWVVEGTAAPNPFGDFQTDGHLNVFSTLRPDAAPAGSLRLYVMQKNTLNVLIFLAIAVIGIIFIHRPLGQKLLAVGSLLMLLVIIGVFWPIFSRRIMGGALGSAIAVVAIAWTVWSAVKLWPKCQSVCGTWLANCCRPRQPASSAATLETPTEDSSESDEPANAEAATEPAGEDDIQFPEETPSDPDRSPPGES